MSTALNLTQCKDYLRNLMNLELACYQQEELLKQLKRLPITTQNEIAELQRKLKTEKEPEKPLGSIGNSIASGIALIFVPLLGALIGVICAVILRSILGIIGFFQNVASHSTGFLSFIWEFFSSDIDSGMPPWLTFIFWGAVIGYAIHFVLGVITAIGSKGENKAMRKAYPEKLKAFKQEQQETAALIDLKKQQLQSTIPAETSKMEALHRQTKEVLNKYYSMGVLYPKYHGIVPVSTLYEYLESGRCFSLLGHEGAYNLYENELRMNVIIGKLDDIISLLEDIKTNQHMLAQELRTCNTQISRMMNSLKNIENNTALAQYYNGITASNTSYMAWLQTWNHS